MAPAGAPHRATCARCRRPASACFCAHIPSLSPRTRVVFLQHPRERRVAVSTCRMAHLALGGSELHHGVRFDDDPLLRALAEAGGVAVLFPGANSIDPSAAPPGFPRTLIVVDGTWSQARKIVERNRVLRDLPRLGILPSRPSNYRLRREPAPHCVSTIEAVVEVLGALEGDRERFRPALAAFDHMIDTQIARRDANTDPPRRRRPRVRDPKAPSLPGALRADLARIVLLYAEANPGPGPDGVPCPPELIQLVATRPATGARFEARVRPRRPLSAVVPHQLEVPAAAFLDGEPLQDALARFAGFAAGADVLAGWGAFGYDLVRDAGGATAGAPLDLRPVASRVLRRRSGGLEEAVLHLATPAIEPWTAGRAGRRIAALEAVHAALRRVAAGS